MSRRPLSVVGPEEELRPRRFRAGAELRSEGPDSDRSPSVERVARPVRDSARDAIGPTSPTRLRATIPEGEDAGAADETEP